MFVKRIAEVAQIISQKLEFINVFQTTDIYFHPLQSSEEIELPNQFTFPFYYEPHQLSILAANELKEYLANQTDFVHNFGLEEGLEGYVIGKMFGVMVVKNQAGELGYLAAFSGKLADENFHNGFVPPIYDTLDIEGFYKQGETKLNAMSKEIKIFEQQEEVKTALETHQQNKKQAKEEIQQFKEQIKQAKAGRDLRRQEAKETLNEEELTLFTKRLNGESQHYHFQLKDLKDTWSARLQQSEEYANKFAKQLLGLKNKRKNLSAQLQKQIHQQYEFLNANGETKNLIDIFQKFQPPAGSGECAAPKLFQFAYQNNYTPICMAEFWWGASPKSEVKKHQQFYTSCRGKCEPILGHMMQGLNVEPNPLLLNPALNKTLEFIYEDEDLVLVNKPAEFLSAPGIHIKDSVQTRLQELYPDSMLVHRLDMSTSGILLVAKNKIAYHKLQQQFIKRTVEKRYVAILDGEITTAQTGVIDLPLRVDLNDRPKQLVCYEHGKPATTEYKVVEIKDRKTRIHYKPITGRTHQLRVHSAHQLGLNTPIVGDDLYGTKANRLHLHAEEISFNHPTTKERLTFICNAEF